MTIPASIKAGEEHWPGLTNLWRSIGDIPRQFQAWLRNFKKMEWKRQEIKSSITRKKTYAIGFLDLENEPVILEEVKTSKGKFLRIENRNMHLSPEIAGRFAEVLAQYAKTGRLPKTDQD